jgi:hypothetical protein
LGCLRSLRHFWEAAIITTADAMVLSCCIKISYKLQDHSTLSTYHPMTLKGRVKYEKTINVDISMDNKAAVKN